MTFCMVFGCKNRPDHKNYEQLEEEKTTNKKFSFHLNEWLKTLYLENYNLHKRATVCSAHFKEENYEPNHLLHKLKKKDVFSYLSEERIACIKKHRKDNSLIIVENTEMYKAGTSNSIISIEVCAEIPTEVPTCKMMDHSTSISPERIFNSPIRVQLRQNHASKIKSKKKKLLGQL
ncbi:uncharacterized protein LOC105828221 isoform X2 [Monomorium pharaonis]|uniref:uncharacterized protein LOC105828221 isoform X2 n=1 Tax=Monomorium pharaonis TaxID=307658 RepID=UPI00102E133E|nr:uncharacterized protein LOC105828221 isoform X2 [Monomorium pharaonis]